MSKVRFLRRMLITASCAVVFGHGPVRAAKAETVESTLSLSLEEAVSRAELRAPDVVLAGRAVREAEALRVGAGVVFPVNPRVAADARPPITGGTLHDLGYAANLEVYFDPGGAPRARVHEAERTKDVATADLAFERLRSRSAAWITYLQIGIADMRIMETKALVAVGERILHASKQRGAAGASGDIEETLATADLGQLKVTIENAKRQRELYAASLRELLDLPPSQGIELTTPLVEPPPPPSKDALFAQAIRSRPELSQIRARVALLDARYDRLGKERFPRLGAYIGVDAAPVSPIFGVLGLSVELPTFQRNAGPRAVVDAARTTELERQELQARRIMREVSTIHTAYESKRAELKILTGTVLPAAERTLDLVEAGWLAGRFDVFRVATATRDLARVRASRLEAMEAAWLDRVALDRAAGGRSL